MRKKKTRKNSRRTPARPKTAARAAFQHFGLKADPFTTLSLQKHNLDYFIGREDLVERLSSAVFSLGNLGVAGEPGVGKSSLMQVLQSRVGRDFHRVSIGVPLDDAEYFLSELLREILVVVPPFPGVNFKELGLRLEKQSLNKNSVLSAIKTLITKSKKSFIIFVDDLEKIQGDRVEHLTRSERTLRLLGQLKPLLELPNAAFVMALQEEFHAKVGQVVREGAEPTVLGLFKNVVLVERFSPGEMLRILDTRLKRSGFKGGREDFLEPEALTLALSIASGNPRRFLYLLSEAMYRGFQRRGRRVEFQDLFEAVNEHLKLDLVCKKLLYFLAKSGRAVAANEDLQAFMGLDGVSITRRLETLAKNRLAEAVDVADGARVYALPGVRLAEPKAARPAMKVVQLKDEKMYHLDENE